MRTVTVIVTEITIIAVTPMLIQRWCTGPVSTRAGSFRRHLHVFPTSACGIAIITGFSGIDWQQMFKIKAQTKATGRGRRMLARLPDSFSTI
jgi:hypothetical protein